MLSLKTESATELVDEDGTTKLLVDEGPIRSAAASSCALDKYDIPVRKRNSRFGTGVHVGRK